MKKNVRKRKRKKINRYIPILASGLLIALTVLVISWVFSARRTYTVVILKEKFYNDEKSEGDDDAM